MVSSPVAKALALAAALTLGAVLLMLGASPAGANGVPLEKGDVLADVGGGLIRHFSSTGTLLDTLNTTTGTTEGDGMCFDAAGNLYATQGFAANTMSTFDKNGNLLEASFGSGYNEHPESCVFDSADNMYVGQPDGSKEVLKFTTSGTLLGSFAPEPESRGTDWIDLASDQCTLQYTSEGSTVKRFNVCTNKQEADFAKGLPAPCYAHRILPGGGALVACETKVVRLDASGAIVQTYEPEEPGGILFALNLDPDGTSFWTAGYTSGKVYRIDIATGAIITTFSAGAVSPLGGIAVVGEIVPAKKAEPTELSTSLSGGGQEGATITVPDGTAVTDSAKLSGENASEATGKVTYKVYSDEACTNEVASAGEVEVTAGNVPASEAKTLSPGTYYWQASYGGDAANEASKSKCGSEVETVNEPIKGFMAGGGTVVGTSVHHGFALHCIKTEAPNNLEVNWGRGNRFHLTELTSASCSDDPSISAGKPVAAFNTYRGSGTGTYDGVPGATAEWVATDAGEPGRNDTFQITIKDASSNVVLEASGNVQGNQQALPQ